MPISTKSIMDDIIINNPGATTFFKVGSCLWHGDTHVLFFSAYSAGKLIKRGIFYFYDELVNKSVGDIFFDKMCFSKGHMFFRIAHPLHQKKRLFWVHQHNHQ